MSAIIPSLPKIVRLTFHDCLKEPSGVGCNGCLFFKGLENLCNPGTNEVSTNNDLYWTAAVLEEVFKDRHFGNIELNTSLYESGKSRADLWAFAGLVALQEAAKNHNNKCSKDKPPPCLNQINKDSPPCWIDLPELKFKSGRSDCTQYELNHFFSSTNEEIHPSNIMNGSQTTLFFKENFGFTKQETVAIMGLHTLGLPNDCNSLFSHLPWVTHGEEDLNNMYFVNMVNKTNFRFADSQELTGHKSSDCAMPVSAFVGNEYGHPVKVGYKILNHKKLKLGGPYNWVPFSAACSSTLCSSLQLPYHPNSCCHWNPTSCAKLPYCPVEFCQEAPCPEFSKFMSISMLNPDMGLYLSFDVHRSGRPQGCSGMKKPSWIHGTDEMTEHVG